MNVTKMEILKLYRSLLRESKGFPNYNFRMYALRRIKSKFRENQFLTEPNEIKSCYQYGLRNLAIIKRQVVINSLYRTDKLVIEENKS